MNIIFRFSYLASVLSSAKKGVLNYKLSFYLDSTRWMILKDFDFDNIPADYDGNNYDLIFDSNYNFLRAEKNLEKSYKELGGTND